MFRLRLCIDWIYFLNLSDSLYVLTMLSFQLSSCKQRPGLHLRTGKMSDEAFEVAERMEYRNLVQDEDSEEPQYVRNRNYINPLLVLSRRCIALICLAVLALLFLATYLGYMAKTLPPGAALVTTSCGKFQGRHVSWDLMVNE